MTGDAGGPVDWDATSYDRVADPQEKWGLEVLARLELEGWAADVLRAE